MNDKRISFCALLIVKDEDKDIYFAINSVKDICRQIVVIDTGSTDSTPSICTRLGAEVHFFKWNDSFSDARNYGLKFCRTDWIISLDADEELVYMSYKNNSIFGKDEILKDIGGINVIIENYLGRDDTSTKTRHRYTRIFRNDPRIRYEGRIHEQISHSIEKAGFDIIESDIVIKHYGYAKQSGTKSSRNKELIQKEISDNPADPWLQYHLAETEFSMNNLEKAEEIFLELNSQFSRVDTLQLTEQQREIVRLRLGQISLSKNQFIKLGEYLNFTSDDINREGFRKFILAASYMMQHKFDEAGRLYRSQEVSQSAMTDKKVVEQALDLVNKL